MTDETRPPEDNYSMRLVAIYRHPQGKSIKVYADGTLECRDPQGRKKPTSATAANLAAGHGRWEQVWP